MIQPQGQTETTTIEFSSITSHGDYTDDDIVTMTFSGAITVDQVVDRFNRFLTAAGYNLGPHQRVGLISEVPVAYTDPWGARGPSFNVNVNGAVPK